MFKNIVILVFCFIVTACGVGSNTANNTNSVNNKLNFQKLYANTDFQAMEYGVYNPENAIQECPRIPHGGIWSSPVAGEQPLPSPEPNAADCEMSAQLAYGCNNFAPGSTGDILKKSLVRVSVDSTICSGTFVAKDWILTAAHCVTENNKLVKVGKVDVSSSLGVFRVSAIYVSEKYDDTKLDAVYSPDWALLRLTSANSKAVPIPLAEQLTAKKDDAFMFAGFGMDEYINTSSNLSYRKMYYMTNMYDSSWHGGVSNNYGNIYTVSSKPVNYNGSQSAWSFIGPGDSGGPLLAYNNLTSNFEVAGVLSNNLFCNYPGYFAKLPYPYTIFSSTVYPENYILMRMILNGSVSKDDVKCSGECKFEKKIYVVNQGSNNINGYWLQFNNQLKLDSNQPTDYFPTQIAFNSKGFEAVVSNYMSNTISLYDLDPKTNSLVKVSDSVLPATQNGPIDVVDFDDEANLSKIYVLAQDRDSVSSSLAYYNVENDGDLKMTYKSSYRVLKRSLPVRMQFIANEYQKILLVAGDSEFAAVFLSERYTINGDSNIVLPNLRFTGNIIDFKIKPVSAANTEWYLYLLTTDGIYIMNSLNIFSWSEVGFYRTRSNFKDHLELLQDDSFAISRFTGNQVELYRVSKPFPLSPKLTISLTNTIPVFSPSAMMLDRVNDKEDYLYITAYPRELYRYRLYPNLSTSATPETFRTGEDPTAIVKTHITNCTYGYKCL